jgi:hypothetical protein
VIRIQIGQALNTNYAVPDPLRSNCWVYVGLPDCRASQYRAILKTLIHLTHTFVMKVFRRALPIAALGVLLAPLVTLAAASTTSETVEYAIGAAQPVYNTAVQGGTQAAYGLLPIMAGAAVLLVILGLAGYMLHKLINVFRLGGKR